MGWKEEVHAQKGYALLFLRDCPNLSPIDLPTRKKHDAVPPQLLNADPLAQIIGTETIADVIINDAEACALLDSRATAALMTLAYAEARNFNIRPMVMSNTTFRFWGSHHMILIKWLWWLKTILPSAGRSHSL